MLPLSPGRAESHGFEYKQNGTLRLFAALNTATGEVLGKTAARHTSEQSVAFLHQIVASKSPGRDIHAICDKVSGHPDGYLKFPTCGHPNFSRPRRGDCLPFPLFQRLSGKRSASGRRRSAGERWTSHGPRRGRPQTCPVGGWLVHGARGRWSVSRGLERGPHSCFQDGLLPPWRASRRPALPITKSAEANSGAAARCSSAVTGSGPSCARTRSRVLDTGPNARFEFHQRRRPLARFRRNAPAAMEFNNTLGTAQSLTNSFSSLTGMATPTVRSSMPSKNKFSVAGDKQKHFI